MDFLLNEKSIHGQFHDILSFRDAFSRLMVMRNIVERFNRNIYCLRTLLNAEAMPGVLMLQAISRFTESQRRAAMIWLTKGGPFWDDLRHHSDDDYLECNDEIVTDTAIGEAAFRDFHGVSSGLISAMPSKWNFTPVEVIWRRKYKGMDDRRTALNNWWEPTELKIALEGVAPSIMKWRDLHNVSRSRFANLVFADDWLEPLNGESFVQSSAKRILFLLSVLNRFARAFDASGIRTPEGHQIHRDYFTGSNALFSDSSDTEKARFRNELTFPHPNEAGRFLFSPWHGKERHLTLRLHYSWTRRAGDPVFVVYAGPKITRR